jgi:hypothetical protein
VAQPCAPCAVVYAVLSRRTATLIVPFSLVALLARAEAPPPHFAIHERVAVKTLVRADAEVCLVHLHGNEVNAREVMHEHAPITCANALWLDDARDGAPWGDDRIPVPSATHAAHKCAVNPNRVLTPAAFAHRIGFDCDDDETAAAALRAFLDEHLLPALARCRGGDKRLPVIAYHNNSRLTVGDLDARAATSVPGRESDIVLVTRDDDYRALTTLGRFSTALQSAPPADDGSLSVFLQKERYINIEAQVAPANKPVNAAMSEAALRALGAWRCGPDDVSAVPVNGATPGARGSPAPQRRPRRARRR